jgi:hypothetical protein
LFPGSKPFQPSPTRTQRCAGNIIHSENLFLPTPHKKMYSEIKVFTAKAKALGIASVP